MLTVYNVQPEVKRPGDTLKHHVGYVMAQDAPYQNSDQVGLAVRDIFLSTSCGFYTLVCVKGTRLFGQSGLVLLRVAGSTP